MPLKCLVVVLKWFTIYIGRTKTHSVKKKKETMKWTGKNTSWKVEWSQSRNNRLIVRMLKQRGSSHSSKTENYSRSKSMDCQCCKQQLVNAVEWKSALVKCVRNKWTKPNAHLYIPQMFDRLNNMLQQHGWHGF